MAENKKKKQRQQQPKQTHRVTITDNVGFTDAVNSVVRSSTERLAEKYADTLKELSKN